MMDTKTDIRDLARAAREGDQEALGELVECIRPRLFTMAYAYLHHYQNAQDAVASALVRICLSIDDLRDERQVMSWMERIVRNESLKIIQRNHSTVFLTDDLPDHSDSSRVLNLRLDIDRALRCLPKDNARAIALFYLGGVSINEIARRMDRPIGTVKRWLYGGRHYLAKELEDYAPMKSTLTATIFSTELSPDTIDGMRQALLEAGFGKVMIMSEMPELARSGEGDSVEFHLPLSIADTRFVILDEQVGGRSAFELYSILKVSVESSNMASGILLSKPADSTIFAAWAAGFDLCLSRDVNINEFKSFCEKIRMQYCFSR